MKIKKDEVKSFLNPSIKNFLPRYFEIINSLLGSKKEMYFPKAKFEKIKNTLIRKILNNYTTKNSYLMD